MASAVAHLNQDDIPKIEQEGENFSAF